MKRRGGGSIKLNPREGTRVGHGGLLECLLHLQRLGVGEPGERSTSKRELKGRRMRICREVLLGQMESSQTSVVGAGQLQIHSVSFL